MFLLKAVSINADHVEYLAAFFFLIYFIKTITWFPNICCLFHEAGYLILLLCNKLLFFTTLMCHLNYKITSNSINIKNLQLTIFKFSFLSHNSKKDLKVYKAYFFIQILMVSLVLNNSMNS